MAAGSVRWTLIRAGGAAEVKGRVRLGLVVSPPEWGRGLTSLIKASSRYRDVGLLVTNIGPASAAAAAGIERGDVLLRYDGVPLEHAHGLKRLESAAARGGTQRQVPVDVVRGERDLTLHVHPGRMGITVSPFLHRLGAQRPNIREDDTGADERSLAVVEVPMELVPHVAFLAHHLQRSSSAIQRKHAAALLTAATLG